MEKEVPAPWQNQLFTGTISPAGDHDFYSVDLVAGRPYILEAFGTGAHPLNDTTLALRFHGSTVRFNDDVSPGVLNSRIEYTPSHSGQYFLDVGGFGANTGSYRVTSRVDDAADDRYTTDSVSPNGVRSGTINNAL